MQQEPHQQLLVERPNREQRLVERPGGLAELLRGAPGLNAEAINLAVAQEKARNLQIQTERQFNMDALAAQQREEFKALANMQENALANDLNAQKLGREIRGDVGKSRDEVRGVGNQVAAVGARMDEGFHAMNGHFAQLNINLKNFAGTRNSCFDILNFESIPQTIIKFFSCLLALFFLLLNLARLAFNILREVRNIFYNVLQDATSVLPFKLDLAIKWAMILVEINFYCIVVQTVGVFFGIERLDKDLVIKLGDLSVNVLNFLHKQIVAAITGSTLRELGGVFKEKLKEADAIQQLLKYIAMAKSWINDYVDITKKYLKQEATQALKEGAKEAAATAASTTYETAANAAQSVKDSAAAAAASAASAASTAASTTYAAAAAAKARLMGRGGRSLNKYGGGLELQEFGFLNDTRSLKLVSSIFDYMERNIQKPDEALIAFVSNPQVQERMRLIQQYCIALFPSKTGGRKTHRRKRSKRVRIRSKRYN